MNSTDSDSALELIRDFVNTRDVEEGTDALAEPAAMAQWVGETASIEASVPEPAEHARALELREALRAMLLANNGVEVDPAAMAPLRAAAGRARIRVGVEGGEVELRSEPEGLAAFEARLLLALADAQARGSWERIKACPADDCQWAFYDESRNRSRTWCSMEVCGNRAKTRSYRHRRRHER
ncbi:MAG: CGNR zinc finger domain-containing protein [Solirubrobacterales bacterium]